LVLQSGPERRPVPMPQILRNKNLATKFQILVEVAANQPNVQQKYVAQKLGVSSQAVSEYINELVKDGWLVSDGRSRYRVTRDGVNWLLNAFRELREYSTFVEKAVTNIAVCAAVAGCDLSAGQAVALKMKDGLLYATAAGKAARGKTATGTAIADARKGEDVGVSNIEGIVELAMGKVTVLAVPDIQGGGSKSTDLAVLKRELGKKGPVGAIGIEAFTALRGIGVEPHYFYGVSEAAIEAAQSGLSFLIVCAHDQIPHLLARLREENVDYELVDLRRGEGSR